MPPKIVNLKRIANDKTRITTYKKRKACLYKKAEEFSTLCGVDTCLIVYGPTKATDAVISQPEVWPRDETKVRDIIRRYKETVSNTCRKENHIETFVNDTGKEKETESNNKRVVRKKCSLEEKLDKSTQEELHGILLAVEGKLKEAVTRQNRVMSMVQHQAMETQNMHGIMDQYFMPQYLPEQQPQVMWSTYSFIRPHEDQMQLEPNLMENSWTDLGISQALMLQRGNDGQMMQRPGPYHNVEQLVQMSPAFAFNPGYPAELSSGAPRWFQMPK